MPAINTYKSLQSQLDAGEALVMGVLNVTPDSFSDGGKFTNLTMAESRAEEMISEGVDIIDIGGESTRPGAKQISTEEEIRRVIPIVRALSKQPVWLSVDTSNPVVMSECVALGVDLINDIRSFSRPDAFSVMAKSDCMMCFMHMQGQPDSMQDAPLYQGVVHEVQSYLSTKVDQALAFGLDKKRFIIDPGIGFGKTFDHNMSVLLEIGSLHELELPILLGVSRKSFFETLLNRSVDQRLAGGLAVAYHALLKGVQIIRTHDVAPTVDVLKTWSALSGKLEPGKSGSGKEKSGKAKKE